FACARPPRPACRRVRAGAHAGGPEPAAAGVGGVAGTVGTHPLFAGRGDRSSVAGRGGGLHVRIIGAMSPARVAAPTLADVRARIARRLSEYEVTPGPGEVGVLTFSLQRAVTRTFRAHWTGFKLIFPGSTVVMRADVGGGRLWAEGYIST